VSTSASQHMAAVVLGCRIYGLVATEWAIFLPFHTKDFLNKSSHLVGAPFLALWAVFSLDRHSLVGSVNY